MNTSTKHFLPRIISAVIAVLLALTVAVPAMAEPTADDNLTITIKNNKGLPAMTENMFAVYQLFKGTPEINGGKRPNPWEAENWNNYVLADIEWGASVETPDTFIEKLQALDEEWAKDTSGTLFDTVKTAADLAKVLVGKGNEFMQHFAKWLVKSEELTTLEELKKITVKVNNATKPEDDSLIYQVEDAGYYLLAEINKLGEENTAESEYIIAVLGNQTINLKASIPTVDKEIKTDAGNVKGTSADINEELTFVIGGSLPKNYGDFTEGYEYIFHDSLPNSYSTIKDVVVTITTDVDEDGKISNDEIFTLTAEQYYIGTRSNTLEIECTQEFLIGKVKGSDGKIYSNIKTLQDQNDDGGKKITINSTSKITVQYTTSLDGDAKLGNNGTEGNKSTVILQYSNDPNAELTSSSRTAYSEVYVYTYGLDLKKVESARKTGLAGAGFLLYKTDGEGKKISYAIFDTVTDSNPDNRKVIGYRFKEWTPNISAVDELINNYDIAKEAYDNASKADRESTSSVVSSNLQTALNNLKPYLLNSIAGDNIGDIPDIIGIAADTYALKEVVTPAGYNTMADFNLKITEELTEATGILENFTYTSDTNKDGTEYNSSSGSGVFNSGLIPQQLENIKAPLLPFTGGIGTVIFYVLGGTLVAGAIVYIVIIAKKRRKETENSDK